MISKFDMLDKCLSQEMSVDYWNDEESEYANELITSFQDNDWEELESNWATRSDTWKERCASLLDIKGNQKAFAILKEMANEANIEIISEVLESLQSFVAEAKCGIDLKQLENRVSNCNDISEGFKLGMLDSIKAIKNHKG